MAASTINPPIGGEPHPCIGQFRFINLTLLPSPSNPSIISRLKSGSSILDLGCCVAQDLRKLVHDGAPSKNMYGVDLHAGFLSLGYDLFLDKDTFQGRFFQADIFDVEGQIKACERIVALGSPVKGTLIVGQQTGKDVAGNQVRGESVAFKHNVGSFEDMWRVVGEKTGTRWTVRARLEERRGIAEKKESWDDPSIKNLVFEVDLQASRKVSQTLIRYKVNFRCGSMEFTAIIAHGTSEQPVLSFA